jgi:glycosyltransferase involved in cell wall biosynthesis
MDRVAARVPDAELVLVGGSDDDRRDLRQRCARAGLDDVVTFTGWVEFEAALGHVADSDVCLVPHRRSPHTETTIPHKLFQYMALARPVAVTDLPPLERVVKDADAGRVVPPTDPEALAESLLDLYENPERAAALGANGRRAVEDRYNFSRDAATLRGVYRRVRRSA